MKPKTQDRGANAAGRVMLEVAVLLVAACVAASLGVWLIYAD